MDKTDVDLGPLLPQKENVEAAAPPPIPLPLPPAKPIKMPTVKKYEQKFRKLWLRDEALKDWIKTVPGDDTKSRCKFCKIEIKAKYQDLKKHAQSKRHVNTKPVAPPPKGPDQDAVQQPSTPTVKKYKQKFRRIWLQDNLLKDWIKGVPGDDTKARCKFCKTEVKAKYQDLKMHSRSKKHIKAMPATLCPIKPEPTQLEGSIAMHLCCHSTLSNCEHLVDLCKNNIQDSKIVSKMKMHRTKCSNIIKNILCNYFERDLLNDIGNHKFSLLLGDSNYISEMKLLGVSIVYYSKSQRKVVSTYFALIKLEKFDSENIVRKIKELLAIKKLHLKNLVGFGTDNASSMGRIDDEVYARLKIEVPCLILVRCVCHSLQFAISHTSSECLPLNLEFLVAETHKWFFNSSVRQNNYKILYEALNETPIKVPVNSKTRWLSVQPAVDRVIELWAELRAHFETARQSERCYTAEILFDLYSDEKNLAFLLFLQPILMEVQKLKELFQSKDVDKVQLLDDLLLLIGKIGGKIALPPCEIDLLTCDINQYLNPNPHLGDDFETKIEDMRTKYIITINDENILRGQCQNFLLSLFEQLKQRLLDEVTNLQNLSLFTVKNILQPTKDITSFLEVMKYLGTPEDSISEAEYQLTKIIIVDWNNKSDTETFWTEVIQYKDASGCNSFEELGDCAISAMILLQSNSEIELSPMHCIKSKYGNEIEMELLHAILMVKFSLKRLGKCSGNYQLPPELLENIGKMVDDVSSQPVLPNAEVEIMDDGDFLPCQM